MAIKYFRQIRQTGTLLVINIFFFIDLGQPNLVDPVDVNVMGIKFGYIQRRVIVLNSLF